MHPNSTIDHHRALSLPPALACLPAGASYRRTGGPILASSSIGPAQQQPVLLQSPCSQLIGRTL